MLLTPYFPHQEIYKILQMLAVECINSGNDNFLNQYLKKVHQTVKFRQALDQLSSPAMPLSVNNNNNNNNNTATDKTTSLIGNYRFIAQNNFQDYPSPSSPPLQQQQQKRPGFGPIISLNRLIPPRSLDEINNRRPPISSKPIKISDVYNNSY
jgi:hypothetical protein